MSTISIHPGLEGIYLCETELSDIKGEIGELTLRGFPLEELALKASYEEMLFLMWNGDLPSEDELYEIKGKLSNSRQIEPITLEIIKTYANNDPMEVLRMAVASIPSKDFETDMLSVVAKIPTMLAYLWRIRNNEQVIEADPTLDHVTNFIQMLGLDQLDRRSTALTTYLNTVIDHGMNSSTFTARTIFSTDSDVISSIVGAIGALKGPKHGGAPGPVLEMLYKIGTIENAESWLSNELDNGRRLMGFGHRVYKTRDPRAEVLSKAASEFYQQKDDDLYNLAKEVETKAIELLEEYKPGRNLQTNVEFYTALLLNGIGIDSQFFSSIFAMSRVGGWTAHLKEQKQNNRLIRPRAKYIGEFGRKWLLLEDRKS